MENTSGGGSSAAVPEEVDRWNWGAFLLTWIWGVGNDTYRAFLMFVPFVNIVMWFILGAKGSAWAWQNRRWNSVEEFKATQRKWALWGAAVLVLLPTMFVALFFTVTTSMRHSDAYKLTVSELNASQSVAQMLGRPISTGNPMGSISTQGSNGTAQLSFSAKGPHGSGTVYVEARKSMGQWRIEKAVFQAAGTQQRIDLENDQGQ
jgi:hypothetical protein